jgi:hypothetical protein
MLIGELVSFLVAGAFWRRFFGTRKGIGNVTRFWKYLILAIIVLAMYYTKSILNWENWRMYWTIVWFMIFWAIGHGTWYCFWDHSDSGEGRLPLIDKIIWFFIGVDESITFWGNAFGMCVRYELTAIPVAFSTSWWFLLAGPIVSLCYVPAGFKKDTRIGEWLAGASIFGLLYLCIGG